MCVWVGGCMGGSVDVWVAILSDNHKCFGCVFSKFTYMYSIEGNF